MSSAVKILPHYTYDEYCLWEGRWELIEGIPYSMSPSPVPEHQAAAGNIFLLLTQALRQNKCACKAYLPLDYHLSGDTILQPDVLVVCKSVIKKYLDFPPVIVVEVLSPATAMKDRNSKFYLYEAQKIPYYIIVDTEKQEAEIYKLSPEGKYIPEKADPASPYTFILDEGCAISLVLNDIWQ